MTGRVKHRIVQQVCDQTPSNLATNSWRLFLVLPDYVPSHAGNRQEADNYSNGMTTWAGQHRAGQIENHTGISVLPDLV